MDPLAHLWVVGPGRVGLALGLALHRAGAVSRLTYFGRRASPPRHPLFEGSPAPAAYVRPPAPPDPSLSALLIAVPDAEVADVARSLAEVGWLSAGTPVLHTSGSLGADVLAPLAERGLETGSLHPLAAVSDPVAGADRLRCAWFAVEGSEPATALAERLAGALAGRTLRVAAGEKPLYHAAAVFASNYVVALLCVAERLMGEAGVAPEEARAALAELAIGAVQGVARAGPARGLTGPVARGDELTVRAHLARLSAPDRALYSVLARETLALARAAGLDAGAARRLEEVLAEPR